MKSRPKVNFDADAFISGASALATDEPVRSSRSNTPAGGFLRRSFDLRESLFKRLKIFSVEDGRPMREIVEAALEEYLAVHE